MVSIFSSHRGKSVNVQKSPLSTQPTIWRAIDGDTLYNATTRTVTNAAYLLMGRATGICNIQWLVYRRCLWYAIAVFRNILRHWITSDLHLDVGAPAPDLMHTSSQNRRPCLQHELVLREPLSFSLSNNGSATDSDGDN